MLFLTNQIINLPIIRRQSLGWFVIVCVALLLFFLGLFLVRYYFVLFKFLMPRVNFLRPLNTLKGFKFRSANGKDFADQILAYTITRYRTGFARPIFCRPFLKNRILILCKKPSGN